MYREGASGFFGTRLLRNDFRRLRSTLRKVALPWSQFKKTASCHVKRTLAFEVKLKWLPGSAFGNWPLGFTAVPSDLAHLLNFKQIQLCSFLLARFWTVVVVHLGLYTLVQPTRDFNMLIMLKVGSAKTWRTCNSANLISTC